MDEAVALAIAEAAFQKGFCWGADPEHVRRRHVVDPMTHRHWKKGFDLGKEAAAKALVEYKQQLRSNDGVAPLAII